MTIIRRLGRADVALMQAANRLFAEVFGEEGYHGPPAGPAHLEKLLSDDKFIALAAYVDGEMVGALAAYELVKFEAERSEIYIYDLAVIERFRRQGVATALIEALKPIALGRGAWVIFVQADPPDEPAVALYDKLGTREEVLHFDFSVSGDR
ncbi:GNAT family N-acetyltransferase [Sphingomonas sp. NSE70-1]|uniref:GNAT family N-acetyltransferase n=1 Tax=Sphingomonas caseinilyticus TaxID=2908205 RepID=A0ABT0RQF0_9SPHN|nr:GNAT family N-acetyltransferase [Sphingomonas caseinilyticus]MCL6697242.1 GNAT family N-acetyltransferase [Sphingomonas caseinilyticus]